MVNRFEKFICNITEIDLYWHRIASAEMKRFGLKGSYAVYFPMLYSHQEGMSSAELAAACGRDKADVSRDIAALEKQGLVCRLTNGKSAYRARIVLTEKGREIRDVVTRKAELAVDFVGSKYSEAERECFNQVFDTITENLRILSTNGLPEDEKE